MRGRALKAGQLAQMPGMVAARRHLDCAAVAALSLPAWLQVELLHGITFACAWAAGTVNCSRLSPPGFEATVQAIFSVGGSPALTECVAMHLSSRQGSACWQHEALLLLVGLRSPTLCPLCTH